METSKQFRFLLDLLHSERQLKKKFHNLNKIFDTFLSWWMIIKWIRWMIITIGNFHIMNWNKFLPRDHSELTVLNKEQQSGTQSGCPGPHPTWSWTAQGIEHPQPIWAASHHSVQLSKSPIFHITQCPWKHASETTCYITLCNSSERRCWSEYNHNMLLLTNFSYDQ